jgi:hypothetical protein
LLSKKLILNPGISKSTLYFKVTIKTFPGKIYFKFWVGKENAYTIEKCGAISYANINLYTPQK